MGWGEPGQGILRDLIILSDPLILHKSMGETKILDMGDEIKQKKIRGLKIWF